MSLLRRRVGRGRRVKTGSNTGGSDALYPYALNPEVWWRGDDPAAAYVGSAYAAIPNRGFTGNSVGAVTVGAPAIATVSLKNAPLFTAGGALSAGLPGWMNMFHDPASNCTFAFRARFDAAGATTAIVARNRAGTAGQKGFYIQKTSANRIQLVVGDGVTDTLNLNSGATTITTGAFNVLIVKELLLFTIYVNGASYTSGSASALVAGPSAARLVCCGNLGGTQSVQGAVPEMLFFQSALDGTQRTALGTYLDRWA